jgi:hypothetical protein
MTAEPPRTSQAQPGSDAPSSPFTRQRLLLAVLLLSAAFAVIYLVAANVILRTRLLREWVSEGPDVELGYQSAYSVWPGLVHVRGLELQVQDFHHQFAIATESAELTVSLHELLLKRFHVTGITLAGLSYRFRDKLPPAEINARRVAAYPPIAGFADPPLLVGEEPPPTPDEGKDKWQIRLEDVRAELSEIWFFEYRYRGGGLARGGFEVLPGRSFAVYPTSVALLQGELNVGNALAARRLAVDLEGYIDYTDTRQTVGAALAEKITARVSVEAQDVNLHALDSRTPANQPPRLSGRAALRLAASVSHGLLDEQSTAQLDAEQLSVRTPIGKLSGAVRSNLTVGPEGRVDWVTTSGRLTLASAARQPGPVFDNPRLAVQLGVPSVGKAPELRAIQLEVPKLRVPSLAWAKRWLERAGTPLELRGQLEGRVSASIEQGRGPSARVRLRLSDAELSSAEVRAALTGRIEAELDPVAGGQRSSAGHVDIELDGVDVESGGEKDKPFRAALRLPDLKLSLEPEPALSSSVDVFAKPADSLLSLALGSPLLEELVENVFDLRRLDARARVSVSHHSVRVELASAESGALSGAGFWQRPAAGNPRGAFLISSNVANLGISLSGSDTEMTWFVADDWLSRARTGAPPERSVKAARGPARRSAGGTNAAVKKR